METITQTIKLGFPIVVCAGPIRSGTTWIYELLKSHPQCITTDPKETSFFCINFDKGIEWFLSRFQKSTEKTLLCADISPSYFIHHQDLLRVKAFSDQVKVVICLRNPFERMRSIHQKLNEGDNKRAVLDYISNESLKKQDALGYNIIAQKAQFFQEHFGKENLYFFLFDDLKTNPEQTAKDLLDFLGLDHFISVSVGQVVNPTYEPRSRILQFLARKTAAFMRALNLNTLVDSIKFSIGRWMVYGRRPSRPAIDESDMEQVLDHFKDVFNEDIERLEEMTGRDLAHWKRR